MNSPALIHTLLTEPQTIAVVGLSLKPANPSHYVSDYMQKQGFKIFPVNPGIEEVLGEKSYPSLAALCEAGFSPHIVNVFRSNGYIPSIVDEMLEWKLPNLWIQQGIVHLEAAARAEASGIQVVMDRCIMVEHRALAR